MFGDQAKDKHVVNRVNVIVYEEEDLTLTFSSFSISTPILKLENDNICES